MAAAAKPIRNVLLLLGDQHRADCLGCYGNPVVQTPHIDRLAATGVRFTNAFTPQAICTPARACIQTGLEARNHGLIFNWEFQKFRGGELNLRPETRVFSQDLCEAGWRCAHLGKWHVGDVNKPADYGYEGAYHPGYGFPAKHPDYLDHLKQYGLDGFHFEPQMADAHRMMNHGPQQGPQEASVPGYLAARTIEKIRAYAGEGRQWFVSCNFWGPHTPYIIPEPHYSMYDGAAIEPWPNFDCSLDDKPWCIRRQGELWGTGWLTRDNLRHLIGKYYGYISLIDAEIGRILQTLQEVGQLDETLIIYTADHGSSVGSYRMWDKGFGMYDCLWRVPLVASHPSIAPRTNDGFVSLLDLAPTFIDLAGRTPRDKLDGCSLVPLLTGRSDAVRDDHLICEGWGHQIPFWQRMVRTRTAKYIYNPTARDEYYDLAADPHETRNLIDDVDRGELKRMRALIRERIVATNDPLLGWSKNLGQ
ncbi:MAG: sulfatase-like hydrolase/transferase [Planctomycetes bacterium]|nr:sulfatase-like hydrolase/transferase [Planctomycetota bacterium]